MNFWNAGYSPGEDVGSAPPAPPRADMPPGENDGRDRQVSGSSKTRRDPLGEKSVRMNRSGFAVRRDHDKLAVIRGSFALLAAAILLVGMWVLPSWAALTGVTVDNSARVQFTIILSGDSIAVTNTSNTVSVGVELVSKVDVVADMDSRYIRADSTVIFAKRIQNLSNGVDTFRLKVDSGLGVALGFFIDADANGLLDTSVDLAVTGDIVLAAGTETTILIQARLPSGIQDGLTDTISIGAHSKSDTDPSSDTAKLVLTADIAPPREVVLRSPADSATLRTTIPTLTWDTTTDTGAGLFIYRVELTDVSDTDFSDTVRAAYVTETTWAVTPPLPRGTYRWHVRAIDKLNNISAGEDTRVFAVDTAFAIALTLPSDGADTQDTTPTFVWTGDGETFLIHIASDSAFAQIVETAVNLAAKTYTSSGLADSVYYWRVAGVDSASLSGTSATRTFTINSAVIDTGPGQLRVTAAVAQPSILTAQDMETRAVAVFALTADTREAVDISRIRLTHVGGMPATKVTQVLIYRDAGIAAALDSADTLFASGAYASAVATLNGSPLRIAAGDTASMLVVYQTGPALTEGDTFLVQIAAASDVSGTGAISNLSPQVIGAPASSREFTVRGRYPSVVLVTPADGAMFLPPQDETGILPIRIQFSVPIDTANIDSSTVRLVDAGGTNRADSVLVVDSRTIQIKAVYADTQWPHATKFEIRVSTSIRDIDVPADSMQAEFVATFQTLQNAQGEQTQVSTDGKAFLKIDSGDISPAVNGIVAEVNVPSASDTVLAQAMNAARSNPFMEPLSDDLAVYDYKIRKRDPNDTKALIKLEAADFLNPVDVSISVRKPSGYLEAKNTPLSFRNLKLAHFKEDAGQWEIMESATLEDNGNTVTITAPTKEFSLYGVFFAFAATDVKETFRSFPNPADPFTTYTNNSGQSWQGFQFAWNMPKAGVVTIRIYDFAGQLVRTLGPTTYAAGNLFGDNATLASRTWNATNGRGQVVMNGAYFVIADIRYNDGSVETATDRIAVVK